MSEAKELVDAAHRSIEASGRLNAAAERLAMAIEGRSGTVQTVNVPPPPPPPRAERLVWAMSIIAAGAVVAAVLQGQRVTDMRADFARDIDRLERRQDQHAEWARAESGVIRGYIWTGKVPISNPYPKEAAP